jgi:hypothetical protein
MGCPILDLSLSQSNSNIITGFDEHTTSQHKIMDQSAPLIQKSFHSERLLKKDNFTVS